MGEDGYIWIVRWPDFQHYQPERDRPPAFLKMYTKQLNDDRYTDLGLTLRGLLECTRSAFALTAGHLSNNTQTLSRRIGAKVQRRQLDALVQAGFIEIVSRETLEQRLEEFYASRAPARAHAPSKELEREEKRQELSKESSVSSHEQAKKNNTGKDGLLQEARTLALAWNGGSSDEFDNKLDTLEAVHQTKLGYLERDRLWDIAFTKTVQDDELF